jgi:hypothetical protein
MTTLIMILIPILLLLLTFGIAIRAQGEEPREGIPGRRVGGGTRLVDPSPDPRKPPTPLP